MKLFDSFKAAFQGKGGGDQVTTSDELEAAIRAANIGSAAGMPVNANTAMRVSTVFACVRLISGAVANLPLHIKERVVSETRVDRTDHQLWTVLRRRPNAWQTPSQFRRMMQAHLLLRGNAFAMIVRSGAKVLGLIPLDPDRMKVKQLDSLRLAYEYTRRDGGVTRLAQEDVMHLVGLTLDGVNGVSVITYARETLGLSMAQEQHGSTTFKNAARPSMVIVHPKKLGKESLANLRESIEAYKQGGESEGKALVFEEGVQTHQISMTAEDAQWIESRKFSRTDIAMFFGVPPHMIGDTEKSTSWGSGIEQQSIGFVTYTLEDHLTTWEETINRDLIAEPNIYSRFNRKALVRGDIKTRQGFYVSMLQWGVYSPNEVRKLEDENPREGGDIYYDPPNTAGGQGESNDDQKPTGD